MQAILSLAIVLSLPNILYAGNDLSLNLTPTPLNAIFRNPDDHLIWTNDSFEFGRRLLRDAATDPEVSIEVDKTHWYVGENILLHWRVVNHSSFPLQTVFGDDYFGIGRPRRFRIEAVNEKGQLAVDPKEQLVKFDSMRQSAFVAFPSLQNGDEYWLSIPLLEFRALTAGAWTISVYREFDRKDSSEIEQSNTMPLFPLAPVATINLHVREPDERDARRLVNEMKDLPRRSYANFGERSEQYADFSKLTFPVYFPHVVHLARDGHSGGITNLLALRTDDALAVLIELIAQGNSKVIKEVREQTFWRPDRRLSPDLKGLDEALQNRCISHP